MARPVVVIRSPNRSKDEEILDAVYDNDVEKVLPYINVIDYCEIKENTFKQGFTEGAGNCRAIYYRPDFDNANIMRTFVSIQGGKK